MQLSSTEKALYIKLVYYGPGLSGKTTNLETLHRLTDPDARQPMVSLKTSGDRTLFFDLLPFDLGKMYGMDVRLKLYTVPGQIHYDTTRKQVLAGADGVVFVADSAPDRKDANKNMIRYLKNNLQSNGLDPETIPLVFQWNKRDLPDAMPPEQMNADLNWRNVPALCAVATRGDGVLETFQEITALTLEEIAARGSNVLGGPAGSIRDKVAQAFARFASAEAAAGASRKKRAAAPVSGGSGYVHEAPLETAAPNGDGSSELDELLKQAVDANLRMSEKLVAGPDRDVLLARARRERKALARLVQIAGVSKEPLALYKLALSSALAGLDLTLGSALLNAGQGQPLKEVAVCGRDADPLNTVLSPGIGSVASGLLERGQPLLSHDIEGELMFGQAHEAVSGLRAVLSCPVGRSKAGLLLAYAGARDRDLEPDDLEFLALVAGIIALALEA